jgi:hypothetical protein
MVPAKCLTKTENFIGSATVLGTTKFDHSSWITNNLDAEFSPYEYNVCIEVVDTNLKSF